MLDEEREGRAGAVACTAIVLLLLALSAALVLVLRSSETEVVPDGLPGPQATAPPTGAAEAAGPGEAVAVPVPAPEETDATALPPADPPRRGVRGTVRDPAGFPIEGALVTGHATVHDRGRFTEFDQEARTDASGYYRIPIAATSALYLEVRASAPGRYTDRRLVPLPVRSLGFEEAHFVLGEPGSLAGTLKVEGGGDPAETMVELYTGNPRPVHQSAVQTGGRFRIDCVKPGSYRLDWKRRGDVHPFEAPTLVEIHAGQETRVVLEIPPLPPVKHVTVVGIVRDGENREPVPGVEVEIVLFRPAARRSGAMTDSQGRFEVPDVPAGGYSIQVRLEGYLTDWKRTKDESVHTVDVTLIRLAMVRGRVVGSEGKALAGARVRSRSGNGVTDSQGRFEVPVDPRYFGVRSLSVAADGYATAQVPLPERPAPGKAADELFVQLQLGATVTGRVVDTEGKPAGGALVVLHAGSNQKVLRGGTASAEDGSFRFEPLPPGTFRVTVSQAPRIVPPVGRRPRTYADSSPFEVKEGEHVRLPDLRLGKPRRSDGRDACVGGRVVDPTGRAVPGAQIKLTAIQLRSEDYSSSGGEGSSDRDGVFRVDGLVEGRYDAYVNCEGYQEARAHCETGNLSYVLVLKPNLSLRGRVVYADTGAPVTAFRFDVQPHDAAPFVRNFLDQEGRFTLTGLAEDRYLIAVTAPDGAVAPEPLFLEIKGPADPPPVTIRVEATATLEGIVRAPDGSPVDDARIALLPRALRSGDTDLSAATDAAGRFRIERVPAGHYHARVTHLHWVETIRPVTLLRRETTHVELTLADEGGTVHVVVRDPKGQPVPDARITLHRPDGMLLRPHRSRYEAHYLAEKKKHPELTYESFYRSYTETDAAGEMRRTFLPEGAFTVQAAKTGYQTARAPATVTIGTETQVLLTLVEEEPPR